MCTSGSFVHLEEHKLAENPICGGDATFADYRMNLCYYLLDLPCPGMFTLKKSWEKPAKHMVEMVDMSDMMGGIKGKTEAAFLP